MKRTSLKDTLRRALSFAAALCVLSGAAAPFAGLTARADNEGEIERYYQLVDTRVITSVGDNMWSLYDYKFTKDEYVKDIAATTTSLSASQKQPVRFYYSGETDQYGGDITKINFGWSTGKIEWTAPPARLDVYRDGRYVPASYSLQYSMDFHNTLCDKYGKDEYWGSGGRFYVSVGGKSERYVNFDATSDFDTFWKEFKHSFDSGEFICETSAVFDLKAVSSASGTKEIKLQDEFVWLDEPMAIVYAVSLGSVKSLVVYMYEYHEGEPEEEKEEEGGYWQLTETTIDKPEDELEPYHEEEGYKSLGDTRVFRASETLHSVTSTEYQFEDSWHWEGDILPVRVHTYTATCDAPPEILHEGEKITLTVRKGMTEYRELDKERADSSSAANPLYWAYPGYYADVYADTAWTSVEQDNDSWANGDPERLGWMEESISRITVPEYDPYVDPDDLRLSIVFRGCDSTTEWHYEWVGSAPPEDIPPEVVPPITQTIVTPAEPEKPDDPDGENNGEEKGGTEIIAVIVTGVGGAAIAGGAAAAGASSQNGGRKKDEDEEEPSTYRMFVSKDFGDTMKKGKDYYVYARIAEFTALGAERMRPDLTAQIQCFAGDGILEVTDMGMGGTYKAAHVRVPENCGSPTGAVTFQFVGPGGTFTRHVVFKISAPAIIFAQDNMGLPANRLKFAVADQEKKSGVGDGEYRLPFLVQDMPEGCKVTAALKKECSTDANGKTVTLSIHDKNPMPYSVEVQQKEEDKPKHIYEAVIREVADYELPAGTSEGIKLVVTAENGVPGTQEYEKAEREFPIYRIHLGLVLSIEADSIPCYMVLKPGREKAAARRLAQMEQADEARGQNTPEGAALAAQIEELLQAEEADETGHAPSDFEPRFGMGSALLFLYRKSDMSIIRVPATPETALKVTAKRLETDRYCRSGDANESHQKLLDSLGLSVFPTGQLCENGAHKLKFCSTTGALDPPTRIIAEVTITVKYNNKTYEASKDVLLRSQEFRVAQNSDDDRRFLETDKHVAERLLRIQETIWSHHYLNQLFALDNMIDRMLEGYDYRFGYDRSQIANVMRMWTGFIRGDFAGANGTPKGVTFADELAASYAFLQGLRDNTGILGRIAMGVMTAGYSEYVFTTMTLAEEMKQKIFECKGDKDFGFWDGVEMGVKEFGKQLLIEAAMQGTLMGVSKTFNIDMEATMSMWAGRYRKAMDSADSWLKSNSTLYKMGDDALQHSMNFFNSSARAAKAGIDNMVQSGDDAAARGEKLLKKARKEMTAEERAAVTEYEKAMEQGMEEVRALQKAQQNLETVTDPKAYKAAQAEYRACADRVWTNKNALKQLQRNKHPYAQRMRAQFNEYRETLLDTVQLEALDDIAKEMHLPREDFFVMNASNGVKTEYKLGKKVPGDRDISFKRKVSNDVTQAVTIDQSVGERAVARRLYKKMNGREADTIEEALAFMNAKDVTYVNPGGNSSGYVIDHNLNGYEDLAGMVGMKPDGTMAKELLENDLNMLYVNRASVTFKGKEWVEMARKGVQQAATLEKQAASLTGAAKEAKLAQAQTLRYFAQGQTVEGVRQITKQVDKIIVPRGLARKGGTPLTAQAQELHQLALRVGDDIAPAEFEHILKTEFNMDLDGYCDYMAKFLD